MHVTYDPAVPVFRFPDDADVFSWTAWPRLLRFGAERLSFSGASSVQPDLVLNLVGIQDRDGVAVSDVTTLPVSSWNSGSPENAKTTTR